MPGKGDRDVIFRLKVKADPKAMRELRAFGEKHAETQRKINKSAQESARERTNGEKMVGQSAQAAANGRMNGEKQVQRVVRGTAGELKKVESAAKAATMAGAAGFKNMSQSVRRTEQDLKRMNAEIAKSKGGPGRFSGAREMGGKGLAAAGVSVALVDPLARAFSAAIQETARQRATGDRSMGAFGNFLNQASETTPLIGPGAKALADFGDRDRLGKQAVVDQRFAATAEAEARGKRLGAQELAPFLERETKITRANELTSRRRQRNLREGGVAGEQLDIQAADSSLQAAKDKQSRIDIEIAKLTKQQERSDRNFAKNFADLERSRKAAVARGDTDRVTDIGAQVSSNLAVKAESQARTQSQILELQKMRAQTLQDIVSAEEDVKDAELALAQAKKEQLKTDHEQLKVEREKAKAVAERAQKEREAELAKKRSAFEEATGRLRSDVEKFGQLSPAEQQRARFIKEKLDRQGVGALSRDESSFIGQFNEFADESRASNVRRGNQAGALDLFESGAARVRQEHAEFANQRRENQQLNINVQVDIADGEDAARRVGREVEDAVKQEQQQQRAARGAVLGRR